MSTVIVVVCSQPIFDDFKAVKTPPALDHPAILYRGSQAQDDTDVYLYGHTDISANLEVSGGSKTLIDDEHQQQSSHTQRKKSSTVGEVIDSPDFDTQTEADRDNYGIRGDGYRIDLPTTNGEAESLLHDIEVGRVSLRGISGVNVSNLAAKIAIATNSDPQFILKLLITLIESEKSHNQAHLYGAVAAAVDAKRKEESSSSSQQILSRGSLATSADRHPTSSSAAVFQYENAPVSNIAASVARSQDQSPMKLSDLYKHPVSSMTSATQTASSYQEYYPKDGSSNARYQHASTGNNALHSSLVVSAISNSISTPSVQSTHPKTLPTNTSTTSVAAIRPMSSVTPLTAAPEARTWYRDSSVQCHSSVADELDRMKTAARNASYEKKKTESQTQRMTKKTADAGNQYESPFPKKDKLAETSMAGLLTQTIATFIDSGSPLSESPAMSKLQFKGASNHLSSTTIFGDEAADTYTAKEIALSPVGSRFDVSPSREAGDDNWKPLKPSMKAVKSKHLSTKEYNCSTPECADDEKNSLQFSGKQIHDILPRISDIRPRESNASFYPVMTANQTILQGRASIATSTTKHFQDQPMFRPESNQFKAPSYSQYQKQPPAATRKFPVAPPIQIVVPNEVTYADVQCVGVAVNQCLPVHNPSSRWIQCLIEVPFYSVNGAQVCNNIMTIFVNRFKQLMQPFAVLYVFVATSLVRWCFHISLDVLSSLSDFLKFRPVRYVQHTSDSYRITQEKFQ